MTSDTTAVITASLNGNSRNFSISLTPQGVTQPAVSSVAVHPGHSDGGSSTSCQVNLVSAAPSGGTPVTLKSNNANASVQSQITVPAGLTSASFTVTTTAVTSVQSVSISATSTGPAQSTALTLQPAVTLSSLSCTPGSIAPGATATCTVFLSATAPSGGRNGSVVERKFLGISAGVRYSAIRDDERDLHGDGIVGRVGSTDGELRGLLGDLLARGYRSILPFLGNLYSAHGGSGQLELLHGLVKRPRRTEWGERVAEQQQRASACAGFGIDCGRGVNRRIYCLSGRQRIG